MSTEMRRAYLAKYVELDAYNAQMLEGLQALEDAVGPHSAVSGSLTELRSNTDDICLLSESSERSPAILVVQMENVGGELGAKFMEVLHVTFGQLPGRMAIAVSAAFTLAQKLRKTPECRQHLTEMALVYYVHHVMATRKAAKELAHIGQQMVQEVYEEKWDKETAALLGMMLKEELKTGGTHMAEFMTKILEKAYAGKACEEKDGGLEEGMSGLEIEREERDKKVEEKPTTKREEEEKRVLDRLGSTVRGVKMRQMPSKFVEWFSPIVNLNEMKAEEDFVEEDFIEDKEVDEDFIRRRKAVEELTKDLEQEELD